MKIYVCSPYSGNVDENVKFAREKCREIIAAGHLPVAPHLYFPQFLNDDCPAERFVGCKFALSLLMNCDVVYVCGKHVSNGMTREIEFANSQKIPVEYDVC